MRFITARPGGCFFVGTKKQAATASVLAPFARHCALVLRATPHPIPRAT
jgi:hypothetical protein